MKFLYDTLKRSYLMVLLVVALLSLPVAGCGTLKSCRGWGQDAIYPIKPKRILHAAYNAFFDLQTLVPTAGALIFAIDDFDEKASDWASEHNPIFGSQEKARDFSDYLRIPLQVEAYLTPLATPSGDDPKRWACWKAKGILVEWVAQGATSGATGLLKDATDRTRPDGSNDRSFPSHHSSTAFSYATLANRNLNSIRLPEKVRLPLQLGNILLATGVAWARVEGKRHFPSDVLAGAALGYFLTAFIHDAFLGLPEDTRFGLIILPLDGGATIKLHFAF